MGLAEIPLVSIITVNFNGTAVTAALLQSLRAISYRNIEIIVIDNASETPCDELKEAFPEIQLIKNSSNKGFAGANNDGFRVAKGKYMLMLNNDTEVEPSFLEPLVDQMEAHPHIGIVSPKIRFYQAPQLIQFAGYTDINHFTGRGFPIGEKEPDTGQYDQVYETSRAHGAAMLFSRKVYEQVGGISESYFLYYEEMDFCEHVKRAGFKIWYVGISTVYHKESVSVGENSPMKVYYLSRNRIIFMRRNVDSIHFIIFYAYSIFAVLPLHTLRYLLKGDLTRLRSFWKGFIDGSKKL